VPPFDLSALINLSGYAVLTAGAAVWLRANIRKQNHKELQELAETRGQRIGDQDDKIRRQDDKIRELEFKLAELNGQIQAMQALKASEIADEVVVRLNNGNFR
jgi:TolA-binding protein